MCLSTFKKFNFPLNDIERFFLHNAARKRSRVKNRLLLTAHIEFSRVRGALCVCCRERGRKKKNWS